MKFELADKVMTNYGIGKIIAIIGSNSAPYLVEMYNNGLTKWLSESELEHFKETEMKFKVGDRVKTEYGIGEVIYVDNSDIPYLVGIHGLHGHSGHIFADNKIAINAGYKNECCWFRERKLEPVEDDIEIVISKHGKEVRAEFKVRGKVVKESVSKCHPDDRFNFKTGAEIAFERLFEKKKRITFRDMLKKEYPEFVGDQFIGGCCGCPCYYGYEEISDFCGGATEKKCRKCWDEYYVPKKGDKKNK